MIRIAAFSAVAVIALLFIVALFAGSLPISIGGAPPTGPGLMMADQGTEHIEPGDTHRPYNSTPATSGWHYAEPDAPATWGVHAEAFPDEVLLYNLERGGIGVHYSCPEGCDELIGQLASVVTRFVDDGLKVVMAPYLEMDTRIALTAWTFLDVFDDFDEERITTFIDTHESSPNAPEPKAR